MIFKINATKQVFFLCIIIFGTILSACGPLSNGDNITPPSDEGYPTPPKASDLPVEGYPITPDKPDGIPIGLNKPISVGDTSITGYGPVGLPVQIINITFMGEQLGAGVVGADGTFSIPVTPISNGIRIGLLANLDSIQLTSNDVLPGDEAINIPQVGYFIDSSVIR
jgi:hypothetical protein